MKYLFLSLISVLFYTQSFAQQKDKIDIALLEKYIFEKTNELRKERKKKPFLRNDSLDLLARYHSNNMVKYNFYDHIDHEKLSPTKRAEKLGIHAWRQEGNVFHGISENIAQVPWFYNVKRCGDTQDEERLAECMVQGWKKSKPHYKNILSNAIYLGVGIAFDDELIAFGTQTFR